MQVSCVVCTHCGQKVWEKMIHIEKKILDKVVGRLIFEIWCNINWWQIVLLLHEISLLYKSAVQFHLNQCSYAGASEMRIWSWFCSACDFEISEDESKISVLKMHDNCQVLLRVTYSGCPWLPWGKMVAKMRKIWWLWKFTWFKWF